MHRNLLYWLFAPLRQLKNMRDFHTFTKLSSSYLDINLAQSPSRQNATKRVFDALEKGLSDDMALLQPLDEGKRTFFDNEPKEEEKEGILESEQIDTSKRINQSVSESINLNPNLCLSSLDLVAFAFLKEFAGNISDTEEYKLLSRKTYPKLCQFIDIMDFCFSEANDKALRSNRIKLRALDE